MQLTSEAAQTLLEDALTRWGASNRVARCVAQHLVETEQSGHPSHGIRQILRYRQQALDGICDLSAEPSLLRSEGSVSSIDCNRGLGHLALQDAVDLAVKTAAEYCVGVCSVVRCGHAGRMGAWAEHGARLGCVTIVMLAAVTDRFVLAAAPGNRPSLMTNPLAIGVPAADSPLVLDMAMSAIAEGKVMLALAHGGRVAEGTIVDQDGRVTQDPAAFYHGGALLPAAAHKGFALAAIIEAIAVGVTGADRDGLDPISGALVIALRPEVFRPVDDLNASLELLRARIRDSQDRGEPTYAPGDWESARRTHVPIVIDDDVLAVVESG